MAWAMDQHIDKVRDGCGEQHGEKADAIAGQVEKKMQQKTAEKTVAHEMDDIGVQGERGYQSVQFKIV